MREHRHEPFQAELGRARADSPEGQPLAGRLAVGVFGVDEGTLLDILPQVPTPDAATGGAVPA